MRQTGSCHRISISVSLGEWNGIDYRLISRDDDHFWSDLQVLLADSFKASSYRPVERFRHLCPVNADAAPAFYPTFIAAYKAERLVAFAALEYFLAERAWYLWYMATVADMRGRGIGQRIVKILTDRAAHVFTQAGLETLVVVAECEAPPGDAKSEDDDLRRIEFYRRQGFEPVSVSALAPPFGPEERDPVPYWLMIRPVRPLPKGWMESYVGPWLRRIYGGALLNGPHSMSDSLHDYSLSTLGSPPRTSEEMIRDWQHLLRGSPVLRQADLTTTTPDTAQNCTWLTPDAETVELPERGYGAVAVRSISRGTVVGILGGFVVDEQELSLMPEARRHRAIQVTSVRYLVAREIPEVGDLLNHSCEPTCGLQGSSLIVALRDIEPGEELCFDYAMCDASDYDEFVCRCGTRACRGVITGSDWRRAELQLRYAGWFSPYLQSRIAGLHSVEDVR